MKQINKITTFAKAIFKFAFGLIAVVINFLFSDTGNQQKAQDHISGLPKISQSGQDESDSGMEIVSKDGYIDDLQSNSL